MEQLNDRQVTILQAIVQYVMDTGLAIGSRNLSKYIEEQWSAATIRNTMNDLEAIGYLDKSHSSAGRLPSDKGYRYFVDTLMTPMDLTPGERKAIQQQFLNLQSDIGTLLQNASIVLEQHSHQLGVVVAPRFNKAILEQFKLFRLTHERLLIVMQLLSGFVNTHVLLCAESFSDEDIEQTASLFNERLSGLTIGDIRETMPQRLKDISYGHPRLVHRIVNASAALFSFLTQEVIHFEGAGNIASQPEFSSTERLRDLLILLGQKTMLSSVLHADDTGEEYVQIKIGSENTPVELQPFSVITKAYHYGNSEGMLGIIGPKRMPYAKAIPLIRYTAYILSQHCSQIS